MTVTSRLRFTSYALLCASLLSFSAHADEVVPAEIAVDSCLKETVAGFTEIASNGWIRLETAHFNIQFPNDPTVDRQGIKTTYSSLDSSSFPVVFYVLTVLETAEPVDAEAYINERLETLSARPLKLLYHEIVDSGDTIIVDSLCSDVKTRVMRNERMFVGKERIYTLTTLFFPTSAENHDIFIQSFEAL